MDCNAQLYWVSRQAIGSLSFYFFPLVQAGASVKKRESDKQKKPGIDFQKATCSHP